jgi:hypothetical protein
MLVVRRVSAFVALLEWKTVEMQKAIGGGFAWYQALEKTAENEQEAIQARLNRRRWPTHPYPSILRASLLQPRLI